MYYHAWSLALSDRKEECTRVTLPQKQITLLVLGAHEDGFFGILKNNTVTKMQWTAMQVAINFNFSTAAISSWHKQAEKNVSVDTLSRSIKKSCRLLEGKYTAIKVALNKYIRKRVLYIRVLTGNNIKGISSNWIQYGTAVYQKASGNTESFRRRTKWHWKKIKSLQSFNEISGCVRNYMERNGFVGIKESELAVHISDHTIRNARADLEGAIRKCSIKDICNTDETAVLFLSFPS